MSPKLSTFYLETKFGEYSGSLMRRMETNSASIFIFETFSRSGDDFYYVFCHQKPLWMESSLWRLHTGRHFGDPLPPEVPAV